MRRVLVDTNIFLDLALDRQPHSQHARNVWRAVESGHIEGYVTTVSLVNIHYIAQKTLGIEVARRFIGDIMETFLLAEITEKGVREALSLLFQDFEDAVQHFSAVESCCDAIVTRDLSGFTPSAIPIFQPDTFVEKLFAGGF